MISVENLKVEFGIKPLFQDVTFVINDRDRIALVGKNGAGKSTMLKILCGKQNPTDGTVVMSSGTTVGYLPQVMKLTDDATVREETLKAFADITTMKKRIDEMNRQLGERTDYESEDYLNLVHEFSALHDRYIMMGADNYEAEIIKKLVIESGASSYMYNQNVFSVKKIQEQPVSLALALSQKVLQNRGAWRVHGGGFAGTIQAFVPMDLLEEYKATIEGVFGEGACYVLSIRPVGGAEI